MLNGDMATETDQRSSAMNTETTNTDWAARARDFDITVGVPAGGTTYDAETLRRDLREWVPMEAVGFWAWLATTWAEKRHGKSVRKVNRRGGERPKASDRAAMHAFLQSHWDMPCVWGYVLGDTDSCSGSTEADKLVGGAHGPLYDRHNIAPACERHNRGDRVGRFDDSAHLYLMRMGHPFPNDAAAAIMEHAAAAPYRGNGSGPFRTELAL